MPRNWLDETYEALYDKSRSEPMPSDRPHSYRILAGVARVPRTMQLVGTANVLIQEGVQTVRQSNEPGPLVDTTMPPGIFELRFSDGDRSRGFWRLYLSGKRIRAHLSFHSGSGVPMLYLFEGPGLLFPFKQIGDLDRLIPYRGPVEESAVVAWRTEVLQNYDRARATLTSLSADDDIDRAICLIGEGLVQEDIEESFSCFWRAIERVAKMDLRHARKAVQSGNPAAGQAYASKLVQGLINSQPVTLEVDDVVAVTVENRVPGYSGPPVAELYRLRTAIIHENPSPEQMQQIAQMRADVVGLAYQIVRSAIQDLEVPASPTVNP